MDFLTRIEWVRVACAIGLVIFGYLFAQRLSLLADRTVSKRFSRHQAMLIRRIIFYVLFLIFAITALQQLGFKMTVLLGAAGVFTVALSFASQTAASNFVSGVFLLFERPFKIGDTIVVKSFQGTVDSIDLLSTKIRTVDNTLVRIPNEVIMKSEVINSSFYKTKRINISIGVAYKSDVERVKFVLLDAANTCENALKDPPAQVIIANIADYTVELKLMVWTMTSQATVVKNQLYDLIQQRFEQEAIEISPRQIIVQQG